MIFEFAQDFIATGEPMEQKQSRLNAACIARNIANLPKYERRKALEFYLHAEIRGEGDRFSIFAVSMRTE